VRNRRKKVGGPSSVCNHAPMRDSSKDSPDQGKQFRGWRLLGVLAVVILVLAATSFIIDWVVIGPLEGRVF
jgi:hypothetical protein